MLWGDLEERKSANANADGDEHTLTTHKDVLPRSKAFECCVKEYGIKVRKKSAPDQPKKQGGDDAMDWASELLRNNEQQDGNGEGGKWDWEWQRRWRLWGTTIS